MAFSRSMPDADEKAVLAAVAAAVELLRCDRLDRLSGRLRPHSGALRPRMGRALGDDYLTASSARAIARCRGDRLRSMAANR